MGLLPSGHGRQYPQGEAPGEAVELGLKDCIACGCCAYVPVQHPLVQHFTYAKKRTGRPRSRHLRMEAT